MSSVTPSSHHHLPAGHVLRGEKYSYRIDRVLGQGTFGITYQASIQLEAALGSLNANVSVAVKEFFMKDLNDRNGTSVTSGSKGGLYDKYKERFAREAQNLGRLQHPHIVRVLESFAANNTFYYAMEYIGGGSLDDYIARRGALAEPEALRLVAQIGDALTYMHTNKMLHLDLKPGNVVMRPDGAAVLIDFGLSKQYDEQGVPESSTTIGGGTPGYAPLEQAQYHEGRGFPTAMDVYALGATLFKMLTGQRPPEAADVLNVGFPAALLQTRGVSTATIGCIEKAMSPMKGQRYQTVKEFLLALQVDYVAPAAPAANESTTFDNPKSPDSGILPNREKAEIKNPASKTKGNETSISRKRSFFDTKKDLIVFIIVMLLAIGFWTWVISVYLNPSPTAHHTTTNQSYGGLTITSAPSLAEVLLDGHSVGTTPLTLSQVKTGEHVVTFRKSGYNALHRNVTIMSGEKVSVEGTLEAATAKVTLSVNVPNAQLVLDGQDVGNASKTHTMAYGKHRVKLTAVGYEPKDTVIDVSEAQQSFSIQLQQHTPTKKSYTVNGVAFTMVTVKGGSFIMGKEHRDNASST